MSALNLRGLAWEKAPKWIKKHPFALLVSWAVALWVWNIMVSYRWFYDIKSRKFQELTITHINWILRWEGISGPWECTYTENPLRVGFISCKIWNEKDFWPKTYELKWLNKATYTCMNLRLNADWLIDSKSGNCFAWRMSLLWEPIYHDNNGRRLILPPIPWNPLPVPHDSNQW